MNQLARPAVGLLVLVGLAAPAPLPAQEEAAVATQESPTRSTYPWLREHAVPVRSVDPTDDDFADLEPLVAAIGDARIVQLGEPSHGAGAAFAAKVRLVQFLHQRMGFDVLVWESGMYDCAVVDRALRAGEDPVAAGRRGVFGIWSRTAEVAPLFRYAQASHAAPRPLEMAGMDMQFSGSEERLGDDLGRYFGRLPAAADRRRAEDLVTEAVAAFRVLEVVTDGQRPEPSDRDRFVAAAEALAAFAAKHDRTLRSVHAPRSVDFFRHAIENFRFEGLNTFEYNTAAAQNEPPAAELERINRTWNRRDTRNAQIMLWLADEYYRGRKLVVWAHNGHVMNAYYAPDWGELTVTPQPEGMKPVGVFLKEALGDAVYTIGFTGYGGEDRIMGSEDTRTVGPPPAGSFEHALHEVGHAHAFVDFRSLRGRPDHWLRQPLRIGIRSFRPELISDATRVVDGMFYSEVAVPSTVVERP